jgi:hypothetical protein
MSHQIVRLVLEESGELWIDVVAPTSMRRETDPPNRIALKIETAQLPYMDVWLRMQRTVARELVERLLDELLADPRQGADEIGTSLKFRRILDAGADPATRKMVLNFEGQRGRRYRIEVPRDQGALLVDFVRLAAEKAADMGGHDISVTAAEAIEDECAPVEAEVVSLKYDPVSEREILTARLPNNLEYYFALTERQAQELRESARASKK